MEKKKPALQRFINFIQSIFLNGLLTLLPITLTFLLFRAMYRLINGWLTPLQEYEPACLKNIPSIEFILILLFIFVFGAILKLFVLKPLIHFLEDKVILRLPLVRPVYRGIKQLSHALSTQDQHALNKVVLIEFPSKGLHSLGFLTGKFPPQIAPNQEETFYNVYIPTTPNPTTGYYIILTEDKFKEVDLTRQEAMAIIISGGIIKPEQFK